MFVTKAQIAEELANNPGMGELTAIRRIEQRRLIKRRMGGFTPWAIRVGC